MTRMLQTICLITSSFIIECPLQTANVFLSPKELQVKRLDGFTPDKDDSLTKPDEETNKVRYLKLRSIAYKRYNEKRNSLEELKFDVYLKFHFSQSLRT
ncbi:hypothetical protein SAMN05443507_101161 [Alicyclobacillus tolerans]|uniref:Uncharacterized protein n=1 Tax=Alicyclobacillus tolerans TaxID=90970 RepID=A0A1M6K6N6_9BACL|nr:hypothetical protein SAMN05443507_101161 [Alicyclobacillus montanus]